MNLAVSLKLIPAAALVSVVVYSTVQEKAVARPTDSKLLETARCKLVQAAQNAGIELKQTFAKEGRLLRFKAGRYAHARQFKRMRRVIKRQSTVVGRLVREIERKVSEVRQCLRPWARCWPRPGALPINPAAARTPAGHRRSTASQPRGRVHCQGQEQDAL